MSVAPRALLLGGVLLLTGASSAPPAELPESPCAQEEPCDAPDFRAVVTAERPDGPGTSTTLEIDELQRRGARSLPDALALEPSVEVHRGPKAGGSVQLRGFDERSIQFLVEGVPLREVYDGHFELDALPLFAFDRVELERGIVSPLRGPNSAGGVIELRAPTSCKAALEVAINGGRPHDGRLLLQAGRLAACRQFEDVTVVGASGWEHADGHVLSAGFAPGEGNAQFHEDGGVRDGSDYDRASAMALASWRPRPGAGLRLFVDLLHAPRSVPPFEGAGYPRYWRFSRYQSLLVGLSGELGPEARTRGAFRGVTAELHAHLHRDALQDFQDARYRRLTTNPLAWFQASAYENATLGGAATGAWALREGNRLEATARWSGDRHDQRERPVARDGLRADWRPWERFEAQSFTIAAEDGQALGPARLTAGIGASGMALVSEEHLGRSYVVDDRLRTALEARLVGDLELREGVRLTAGAGRKARFPTLKELFSNSLGGNPSLEVERANLLEGGVDLTGTPVEATARLFWSEVRDLIDRRRDAYANVGHARLAGGELDLRHSPIAPLTLRAGYRGLFARDLDADRPLDFRTPHHVLGEAKVRAPHGFSGGVEATYDEGQRGSYVDPVTGAWREDRLDAFLLLHGHVRWELARADGAQLFVALDGLNLLDTNYATGSLEPRPGREWILGLGGRLQAPE